MEETTSGIDCSVECPNCNQSMSISSYNNDKTGKITFTTFNFARHLKLHDKQDDSQDSMQLSNSSVNQLLENLRKTNSQMVNALKHKGNSSTMIIYSLLFDFFPKTNFHCFKIDDQIAFLNSQGNQSDCKCMIKFMGCVIDRSLSQF